MKQAVAFGSRILSSFVLGLIALVFAHGTALAARCSAAGPPYRDITFSNNCGFPVWIKGEVHQGNLPSEFQDGYRLDQGGTTETCLNTPWISGSFLARTNCTGSGADLKCPTGGPAPQPATKAEFTLGSTNKSGGLPIPIPSSDKTFTDLYAGNPYLVPESVSIQAKLAGVEHTAKDNGDGVLSGDGISGTVDYDTGEITQLTLPQAPVAGDSVLVFYNNYGTDVYDVSLINGYNVPITIIPNDQGATAGAQVCSASNNSCPAGFTCDTGSGLCLHTCTSVTQCNGYPWKCDIPPGQKSGVCEDTATYPYNACAAPGCTVGLGKSCGTFTQADWNLSACPAVLQVKDNDKLVGCNTPTNLCGYNLPNALSSDLPNDCAGLVSLSCTTSSDCPAPLTCGTGGVCVQAACTTAATPATCSKYRDCSAAATGNPANNYVCINGKCEGCPSGGFEVCNANLQCEPSNTGLYSCGTGFTTSCQAQPEYSACFSDADCPPRFSCDLTSGSQSEFTCVNRNLSCNDYTSPPPKCVGNATCESNGVCVPAANIYPPFCCGPKTAQWHTVAAPYLITNKRACPTCYTYQYDDVTSTFGCQQSFVHSDTKNLGYEIVFCPVSGSLPATLVGGP